MIFWYIGNSFYNSSLYKTRISSANTLSNISILFIIAINRIYFKAKLTIIMIFGINLVFIGLGGVFWLDMTNPKGDNDNQSEGIIGDLLAILGAVFYSIFAVMLDSYYNRFKNHFKMIEVFGYLGLYNFFLIPFILIFLRISSLEEVSIPTIQQFLYILVNAFTGTILSDTLQTYSILLLSPHTVSFGLTLTIPVSYILDIFLGKIDFDFRIIIITVILIAAFACILVDKLNRAEENIYEQSSSNNEIRDQ